MTKDEIRAVLLDAWAARLREQQTVDLTGVWLRDYILREQEALQTLGEESDTP